MFSSQAIVALSVAVGAYAAIGPSTSLYIANAKIQPDGFNRSAVLAGPTAAGVKFPGPLITGFKGNTFSLNVIDQLNDTTMLTSTSIHWHGFFQKNTTWADGPVGVNQCPISSGHSFLYQFQALDQAGTFWYHSHHSTQYCDGLRGAMVVYDKSDPHRARYDYDDDTTVITLADWYHTPAPSAGLVPTADATLINGIGRYAGGPTVALAVIRVLPKKRYRFRLVSISCDPNFTFSIDSHNFTIIEVDGINVQPLIVDSIQIFAGQRYSFVLNTTQAISNYWIRAEPNVGTVGFDGGVNSAILRYFGAALIDPNTTTTVTTPLVETNLHPLTSPAAPGVATPGAADINLNLALDFDFTSLLFTVNGATFVPPTLPVLLQILNGAAATSLLPSGSVYLLPANSVVEISIPGGSVGSPHPIHLHGHDFSVVRSAGSTVYNYVNPVRRDVVNTGVAGDNTTIRFQTDNAGPWIIHCHIDWHLELGLAVVMAEDVGTVATMDPPTAWDSLCPIYNALPAQTF
ncbi:multicopper oxidase [Hypholoma sublateritium FD-334 SS-4]|uniref:Multicopper oxidase n=1 Tax=Hypholoma sublateritium (strain FD-334 SS-4) TaxID=945553 RepID=A0A0D2PSM4_HYPSF|nr:multicopper oxidase [Hypholoma sublateritium FD-334 SS-4]